MIELVFSILCSSVLFFLFRLFPKFKVDTTQAIVVNYFTAFTCGSLVNQAFPSFSELQSSGLIPYIVICGFLFISLFAGMGYSSVRNGMGTTSVAVKMNMALSVLFFIVAYHEAVTLFKVLGLILAFAGIFLITYERENNQAPGKGILLLLFLFVGSAALDIVLNYVQKFLLGNYPDSLFTAVGFLAAGIIGVIWMTIDYLRGARTFAFRNILAGIILGIPNYFSIYLLVRSYRTTGWSDTTTLSVMGISIVSLAALFGIIIFKESARPVKLAGLAAAIGAILLLAAFK